VIRQRARIRIKCRGEFGGFGSLRQARANHIQVDVDATSQQIGQRLQPPTVKSLGKKPSVNLVFLIRPPGDRLARQTHEPRDVRQSGAVLVDLLEQPTEFAGKV
jgi:hypothetical protein